MQYTGQDLYGGAIHTKIPAGLIDASNLRQVPDTQEVFLNGSYNDTDPKNLFKDDTIIIELLEMIDKDDNESVLSHLSELNNLNGVGENEWLIIKTEKVVNEHLKDDNAYITTCVEPSRKWGRSDEGELLILILGMIRIRETNTDLLISLNAPVKKSKFGDQVLLLEQKTLLKDTELLERITLLESVMKEMISDLEVKDWGLFG